MLLAMALLLLAQSHRVEQIFAEMTSAPKSVPTNEVPDGPILGNDHFGVVIGLKNSTLHVFVSRNDFFSQSMGFPSQGTVMTIGAVDITVPWENPTFHAWQFLANATVRIILASPSSDDSLDIQLLAPWGSESLLFNFTSKKASKYIIQTRAGPLSNTWVRAPTNSGAKKSMIFSYRSTGFPFKQVYKNMRFVQTSICISDDNLMNEETNSVGISTASFALQSERKRSLNVEVKTVFSSDPDIDCSNFKPPTLDRHFASWSDFWNRSELIWANRPVLEKFWYISLYMARISFTPNAGPGLWGPWVTSDTPDWNGDLTLNYNYESPTFGMFAQNHPEFLMSYWYPLKEYLPYARFYSKMVFECSGAYFFAHLGPTGQTQSGGDPGGDNGQRSNNLFISLPIIDFCKMNFQDDGDFCKKEVLPFLMEVAEFWECYLTKRGTSGGGYEYISVNDCAEEECGFPVNNSRYGPWDPTIINENYIATNSYLRAVFGYLQDVRPSAIYDDILSHMADYPTVVVNGSLQFAFVENTNIPSMPYPKGATLTPAFPSNTITLSSDPKLVKMAVDTITTADSWESGGIFPLIWTEAVRVGMDVFDHFHDRLKKMTKPNLWPVQFGGGIEVIGGIQYVNELLMSSVEGFVRFFNMLPKSESVCFRDLRAYGGFLMSGCYDNGIQSLSVRFDSNNSTIFEFWNPYSRDPIIKCDGDVTKWHRKEDVISFVIRGGHTCSIS